MSVLIFESNAMEFLGHKHHAWNVWVPFLFELYEAHYYTTAIITST